MPAHSPTLIRIFRDWMLTAGWFLLLTGLFWLPGRSQWLLGFNLFQVLPLLVLLLASREPVRAFEAESLWWWVVGLCLWASVSLFWSDNPELITQLRKPLYVLTLLLGLIYLEEGGTERVMRPLVWAFPVVAIAVSVTSLRSLLGQLPMPDHRLIAGPGLFNPLLSAHVLGFYAVATLALATCRERRRSWYWLVFLVFLVAILLTGSRTPLMAMAGSILILLVVDRGPRWLLPGLIGLVLSAGLLLWLLPEAILARGLSYRPQVWHQDLRFIFDHPWLGHGLGHSLVIRISGLSQTLVDTHNLTLGVWFDLGIVGLLLWFGMYGTALYRAWQHRTESFGRLCLTLLSFGILSGLTEGRDYLSRPTEHWFLIWIPIGLTLVLLRPSTDAKVRAGSSNSRQSEAIH